MAHFRSGRVQAIINEVFREAGFSPSEIAFVIQVVKGESNFDTHIIGDAGEAHGIFQLHARGLLPAFFNAGFTDWTDPRQQARYVAQTTQARRGDGYNGWQPWSVARAIIDGATINGKTFGPSTNATTFVNSVRVNRGGDQNLLVGDQGGRETIEEHETRLRWEAELDIEFWLRKEEFANGIGDARLAAEARRQVEAATVVFNRLMQQLAEQNGWTIEAATVAYNRSVELLGLNQEFTTSEREAGEKFQSGQLTRQQLFAAGQNQKNRDLDVRLQRLNTEGQLVSALAGAQERARSESVALLGQDPVRGAVLSRGRFAQGTSPVQRFRTGLNQFAQQELPSASTSASSIEDIEANILELQNATLERPVAPFVGGAAHGATIAPKGLTQGNAQHSGTAHHNGKKKAAGLSNDFEDVADAILVGEGQHGEGLAAGTAEVELTMSDGTRHIIPLRGMAAHGGTIHLPTNRPQSGLFRGDIRDTGPRQFVDAERKIGLLPSRGQGVIQTGPGFGQFPPGVTPGDLTRPRGTVTTINRPRSLTALGGVAQPQTGFLPGPPPDLIPPIGPGPTPPPGPGLPTAPSPGLTQPDIVGHAQDEALNRARAIIADLHVREPTARDVALLQQFGQPDAANIVNQFIAGNLTIEQMRGFFTALPNLQPPGVNPFISEVGGLRGLFDAVGLDFAPVGQRLPASVGGVLGGVAAFTGAPGFPTPLPGGATFDALGTVPRLILGSNTQTFFFRMADGTIVTIGDASALVAAGLNPNDAIIMDENQIAGMAGTSIQELLSNVATEDQISSQIFQDQPTGFGASGPIFSPLTLEGETPGGGQLGVFLPAVRLLATLWPTFTQDEKFLFRSAYSAAGVNNLDEQLDFFSPGGATFQPGAVLA